MTQPDFTDQERALVLSYLAQRPGERAGGLGYWVAFVLPGLLFCGFGVLRVDPLAMAIGTAMLVGAATTLVVQGNRMNAVFAAIFQKLRHCIEPPRAENGAPSAQELP